MSQSVEGRVLLDCRVQLDTTTDCRVVSEQPEGWGFGVGAVLISQTFRMSPATINGHPVADGAVRVPINFRLGDSPTSPRARLPLWDDAPTYAQMTTASATMDEVHRAALALLRCVIGQDRRLACERHRATPGAEAAVTSALALSAHFRVSANDIGPGKFNVGDTIYLPILIGGPAELRPVPIMLGHYRPADDAFETIAPSTDALSLFGFSGLHGKVTVLCEANAALALECRPKTPAPDELFATAASVASTMFGGFAHEILWTGAKIEVPFDFDGP